MSDIVICNIFIYKHTPYVLYVKDVDKMSQYVCLLWLRHKGIQLKLGEAGSLLARGTKKKEI